MSVLITGFLLFVNVVFISILSKRRKRANGEPPLLSHVVPFLGRALDFGRDPVKFLKDSQKIYGNIFTFKMAGWNFQAITHPLDIGKIVKNKNLDLAPIVGEFANKVAGNKHSMHNPQSLAYEATHPIHRLNREVPHAMFKNLSNPQQIKQLFQSSVQNAVKITNFLKEQKMDIYDKNNKIDLLKMCDKLIYFMTHFNILGLLPNEEEDLIHAKALYRHLSDYIGHAPLVANGVPIELAPNVKKSRQDLLKFIGTIDLSKRDNVSEVMQQLANIEPNEENRLAHILMVLWVGQINTAPALFWALFYILKYPNARQEIMKEFQDLVKSKRTNVDENNLSAKVSSDDILDLEIRDLKNLVVLDSLMKEVLRVSSSTMSLRKVTQDLTFETHDKKSYRMRKGDVAFFYSQVLHFDEEVYSEPEKFIHNRFLESDGNIGSQKLPARFSKDGKTLNSSNSILSFGFGKGKCPGRHLAQIEIKLMVLCLLTCFDPQLETKATPALDMSHLGFGVLPPKDEVSISLQKNTN